MTAPIVVVGASLAGLRALQALRAQRHDGPVVVVGSEAQLPYDRTLVSKKLLSGDVSIESALLVDPRNARRSRRGVAVGRSTPSACARTPLRVGLGDGPEVTAAGVVIATGARARRLPDAFGPSYVLRTVEDADELRQRLLPGFAVTIIGCGLVGAETAATALGLGCEVTVVDTDVDLFVRHFGPLLASHLRREHEDRGVRFRAGVSVVSRSESEVLLSDGTRLATDVLVAGIGASPNQEWLQGSDVELDDGVCTDAWGRTAVPGVVAVGDVARFADPPGTDSCRALDERAGHARRRGPRAPRRPAWHTG